MNKNKYMNDCESFIKSNGSQQTMETFLVLKEKKSVNQELYILWNFSSEN
jgi:hypothetical protein